MTDAFATSSRLSGGHSPLRRRLFRSPALRRLKHRLLGNRLARHIFTANFRCGRVALGERNSYMFPNGWITLDWQDADFPLWISTETRLPFPDASQDIVYSSHMMEHVEDPALRHLFVEICRILKPGGALRLEVPDAEALISAYKRNDRPLLDYFQNTRRDLLSKYPDLGERILEDHITVRGEIANYIDPARGPEHIPVYASKDDFERELENGMEPFSGWAQSLKTPEQRDSGGHANALTYDKMSHHLRCAGFRTVERSEFGNTIIPGLRLGRGWRRLYDSIPEVPERAMYSLYVEAFK